MDVMVTLKYVWATETSQRKTHSEMKVATHSNTILKSFHAKQKFLNFFFFILNIISQTRPV